MANAASELADELCENKAAQDSKLRSADLPVYACPIVSAGPMYRWRYFFPALPYKFGWANLYTGLRQQ